MIIQCWLSRQVYIRHYSVPLTVSHHPFFATQTVHFVEVRASSVKYQQKIYTTLPLSVLYTILLAVFVTMCSYDN